MPRPRRLTIRRPLATALTAALLSGLVLLLGSCTGQNGSAPATPFPAGTSSTDAKKGPDVTVAIEIRNGEVTPTGRNIRLNVGQTVLITVNSDASDSVHVHGYEKSLAVTPGGTAELTFVAAQSGVFEIETHESSQLVAKLIVS